MTGIEFLTGGANVAALTNAANVSLSAFIAESERQFIGYLISEGYSDSYARVQWVVCGGIENATWAYNLNRDGARRLRDIQREEAKTNALARVGCEEYYCD
jgi:hypothetical protein